MKAIRTRYIGASNHHPARILVDDGDGNRLTVAADSVDYELSRREEGHVRAAMALCARMQWTGTLQGGYHGQTRAFYWTFRSAKDRVPVHTAPLWIVSLEWNTPPSEVTGDTGIVGLYATEAGALAAAAAERANYDQQGQQVYQYSQIQGAYCSTCGEANPRDAAGRPQQQPCSVGDEDKWCDHCGAELTDSGSCNNDHDEWDIDVHVTSHQVQP